MKHYAVIHAVFSLHEGYSDITCEFFPKRSFADKHILDVLKGYRPDKMCVNLDFQFPITGIDEVYVTMPIVTGKLRLGKNSQVMSL